MNIPQYPVAIIGGGPGGLALAQGLKKRGIGVRVYERTAVRDDYVQGFRLKLHQIGLDALREVLSPDLWQAVLDTLGLAPARALTLDETLAPVAGAPPRWPDDPHATKSLSRITLRQVLLSGLDGIVETGRRFLGYEEEGGSVLARFEDGHVIRTGLLVGADGANSRVRAQLSPDARIVDTGVRRLAGKIALGEAARHAIAPLLLENTVHIRSRAGRPLMITSHRVNPDAFRRHGLIGQDDPGHEGIGGFHFDNTTSYTWWNTAWRQGELEEDAVLARLSGAQLRDLLLERIAGWHPQLRALIRHSDPTTIALLHVRSLQPGRDWAPGRVTLLGDAAHAMTYFRGLGANSALHDAGLLVRALGAAAAGDIAQDEAVARYETAMRADGYAAAQGSLDAMLRNLQPREPEAATA